MNKIPLNEVRTKPTVAEGILRDYTQGTSVRYVDYAPGNGTRYEIVLVSLSEEIGQRVCGSSGTMIVLANHGRKALFLSDKGFIHWSYVKEKSDLGVPDAVAVAELLGVLLNRPHVTAEQFMGWQDEMGQEENG